MKNPGAEGARWLKQARVQQVSAAFEGIRLQIAKLDRYYIPTRYPNGLPEGGDPATAFDPEDARDAIATANRALKHAEGFLRDADEGPS